MPTPGDSVYNETRVRGRIVPNRIQEKTVDKAELAEEVAAAMLGEVDMWPEVDRLDEIARQIKARRERMR
jgi:hypothetical protein